MSRIKDESAIARQNAQLIEIESIIGRGLQHLRRATFNYSRMHNREVHIGLSGDNLNELQKHYIFRKIYLIYFFRFLFKLSANFNFQKFKFSFRAHKIDFKN